MGDTKVSDLPEIILPVASNDILYIGDVSAGTSNKITYTNLTAPIDATVSDITLTVDSLSADVLSLSGDWSVYTNDISQLVTDVATIGGELAGLSASIYDPNGSIDESLNLLWGEFAAITNGGYTGSVTIGTTTLTFLSGSLQTVT
tara:strand:+ start:2397 stop:2834 length:438 start_codon:yes stop_codon:yes gene_type:complete